MTQPVPEENNEALDLTEPPADEHPSDLPDEDDRSGESNLERENAESSLDQPSGGGGS